MGDAALMAESHRKRCAPRTFGPGLLLAANLQVIGASDAPYAEAPFLPPTITPELTGPSFIVEGEYGFLNMVSKLRNDPNALTRDLGQAFCIETVSTKLYPCCRHFHAGLDCVLAMKRAHEVAVSDIEEISVYTYPLAIHGHDDPAPLSRTAAQQSYPWMLASAMGGGRITLASLEPKHLKDSERMRIASCVRLLPVQEWADGPMRARVEVRLRSGRVLEHEQIHPLGSPTRPASIEQLETKFLNLTALAGCDGEQILKRFHSLRDPDHVSLCWLMAGSDH